MHCAKNALIILLKYNFQRVSVDTLAVHVFKYIINEYF